MGYLLRSEGWKGRLELRWQTVRDCAVNKKHARASLKWQIAWLWNRLSKAGIRKIKKSQFALQSNNIVMVIADFKMPIMNGWRATEIIRANNNIIQPHIITLTGSVTLYKKHYRITS